jgi:hypothetical protein
VVAVSFYPGGEPMDCARTMCKAEALANHAEAVCRAAHA